MKTFSKLYEEMDWEPTHQKSMSELIFDTPDIGQTKSVADNMWMPMSSGLFKRVMPDMVKATVFHVTGLEEQIDQLIKIQNSNNIVELESINSNSDTELTTENCDFNNTESERLTSFLNNCSDTFTSTDELSINN